MKRQKCKKTWLEREEVMRKCLLEGGVDVSFEGWKCFKQKGRLNKGWRKNKRQRVGTLKETMNIMYAQFPTVLEHPLSEGTPPFWVPPPLSEALPSSLRAIQIGACKLYETL